MRIPIPENTASFALVSLLALLIFVVVLELFVLDFGEIGAIEDTRGVKGIGELQPAFNLPPMTVGFEEMVTRPLFVPDRRAPEAISLSSAGKVSDVVGSLSNKYRLEGIIMSADRNIVLLQDRGSRKYFRVNEGDQFEGVTLKKVEEHELTLVVGGRTEVMPLTIQPQGAKSVVVQNATVVGSSSDQVETGPQMSLFEKRMAQRQKRERERQASEN